MFVKKIRVLRNNVLYKVTRVFCKYLVPTNAFRFTGIFSTGFAKSGVEDIYGSVKCDYRQNDCTGISNLGE